MNPRILVVDDDTAVRHLVACALRRRGFEVIEAEDGLEALAVIAEQGVALALCDIEMPGMDGCALAEIVRSTHPECRILLMSGRVSEDRVRGYPFLQKPFMPSRLMASIAQLMQGSGAPSSD